MTYVFGGTLKFTNFTFNFKKGLWEVLRAIPGNFVPSLRVVKPQKTF